MGDLHLTLACEDYDRTRALRDGLVKPEGIDLNYVALPVEEIFWRMLRFEEFDVAEMSMGAFHVDASRGRSSFIAIPVFPSRTFRHRCIFVNSKSGIERPEDFKGKRVGVPEYTMTASVWLRGMLQHDFGVSLEQVHWVQGGVEQPGRRDRVEFEPPPGIHLEMVKDRTLNDMLEVGDIDALMTARMPACFVQGSPHVRRLFGDFKSAEIDYFRRTGLFPIMHVIVIRADIYKNNPWVSQSLYKAFCAAKDMCLNQIYDTNILRTSLPWTVAEYEDVRELMGEDFWPYGFEANRKNLETFHTYLLEQGLIKKPLELERLFATNTLTAFKI
ncbi:MAG: ABC transporter substrate-binding protein [Deltaproteobacteria bacterium]|nr:ABC transporter substrate-binding protein [Deltaproteobacteria bacterium]